MTVTELIGNFRGALLGVLPSVERVQIPWRRPEAYDVWDSLAATLYEVLVRGVLEWNLPEQERQALQLLPYDLLLDSYAGLSLIEIVTEPAEEWIRVFHALGTAQRPFDTVEWRWVSADGRPLSDIETHPFEGAGLRAQVGRRGRAIQVDPEPDRVARRDMTKSCGLVCELLLLLRC